MTEESIFDMGITSTQLLPGEEPNALDSILGMDEEIEEIPKPEKTKPAIPVKEEEKKEEESIDTILGEEDTKKEEDEEDTEVVNPYASIAKTLHEQGILSLAEGEEVNTPEELLEAFNKGAIRKAEDTLGAFLGRFGDDYRHAFDAIYVQGIDPKEYFNAFSRIEDFSALDMDNEAIQEKVVREYYTRLGWKDARITKTMQLWKDSGELEEYSKEFRDEIVEKDSQALQQQVEEEKKKKASELAAEEQYRQNLTTILREKVKSKDFDGIPVSEKTAQQAFDFLNYKAYQLSNGRQITAWDKFIMDLNKPENHPIKVKIALLANNNFDFSVIKNKETSKQSNSLFGELATRTTKSKKEALKSEQDSFWKS